MIHIYLTVCYMKIASRPRAIHTSNLVLLYASWLGTPITISAMSYCLWLYWAAEGRLRRLASFRAIRQRVCHSQLHQHVAVVCRKHALNLSYRALTRRDSHATKLADSCLECICNFRPDRPEIDRREQYEHEQTWWVGDSQ